MSDFLDSLAYLRATADVVTPCRNRSDGGRCIGCVGCRNFTVLLDAINHTEKAAEEWVSDAAWGEMKEMDGA